MTDSQNTGTPESLPPAGWYPDPEDASRIRYWDGHAWAAPQNTVTLPGATAPAPAAVAPAPVPTTQPQPWTTVGYTQAPIAPYAPAPVAPSYGAPRKTDGFAITSLILGVSSLVIGLLGSIPAIIFGFIARSRIKKSGDEGSGIALAGIIIGFIGVAIWTAIIILFVLLFVVVRSAGTDASGNFNSDTLQARADALMVGAGVSTCGKDGGLPSDQTSFDNCLNSQSMGSTAADSPIAGVTIDYWYRSADKTFCVQVTKGTSTGGWDTGANIPTVSKCAESTSGTMPTATSVRP